MATDEYFTYHSYIITYSIKQTMYKKNLKAIGYALILLLGWANCPLPVCAQTVNESVTATWPFDEGTAGQTASFTPEESSTYFNNNYVQVGSNLSYYRAKAANGDGEPVQTTFQPGEQDSGPTDNNAVEFMIVPKTGLSFTPTKVSFVSSKFGTGGGKLDISWVNSDGSTVSLTTGESPSRENGSDPNETFGGQYSTPFSFNVTGAAASTGACGLRVNIYSLGANKDLGFANVIIEGTISGTILDVKQCNLTVQVSPEGAGTVNVVPVGNVFDENTALTFTQTRNFGYRFTGWSVSDGTTSEEAELAYTITGDVTVTANYERINTYALSYGATGGGRDYMITPTPEPTEVEGKNMYEEGTEVTLTATGNYILDFSNWSTGETTPEIKVTMDQDRNVTAAFAASKDVIAGWDFYLTGNNGRKADFYADDNDADALVMRNEAGESRGWLDRSVVSGGDEGRGAARNWQTDGLGTFYWQTQVNAAAFKDIKVHAAMMFNYNTLSRQDVEWSLDGQTWNKIGTYELTTAKQYVENTFDLPAEANNQATVYIRWKGDKTADSIGTTSDNDGISIADIYITGTPEIINDGMAPKLESTVPAEGATNASANGRIVLNFDERVKMVEGTVATLGTQELQPTVSGQTVTFEYKGLDYATPYTFTLPANSVSDLTDNFITDEITVNFTTMTRPTVTKAEFDFIVPDDGTITEALAAAAAREDESKRFYIFVKQGEYVIPASETSKVEGTDYPHPATIVNTPNVSIIGEGMDNTSFVNTVPYTEPGTTNPIEGLGKCETFRFESQATNMYLQDVTIKNGLQDNTGRGAALEDGGDKNVFKNVRLYGYQDTYNSRNNSGRYYFEGGEQRGRTDFLCGGGDAYFNGVTLVMCEAGGFLAVPSTPKKYGYIFMDCTIKGENSDVDGNYSLGRPWGNGTPIALYINTRMEAQPTAEGWSEMGDGYPARFAEYNSTTASGTVISLNDRKKTFGDGHENNPELTEEEAAFYTVANVMGEGDDWDPTAMTEQASAPTNVYIEGTQLTWDDNQYVLCWAVCKDGKVIDFTTTPEYTVDDASATYSVRAANQMGGLGEATVAEISTGINEIDGTETGEAVKTEYYSIDGARVSSTTRGVVIEVKTMADGSKTTKKIINK